MKVWSNSHWSIIEQDGAGAHCGGVMLVFEMFFLGVGRFVTGEMWW